MKALLCGILLAFTASIGSSQAGPAATPPSPADIMRMAVVDLEQEAASTPAGYHTFCTGVAVGRHTILTQKHCMDYAREYHHQVFFNRESCPEDGVIATEADNVLVHTCHEWPIHTTIGGYTPEIGEKVFEYGHPLGLPVLYREGKVAAKLNNDGHINDLDDLYRGAIWVFDVNETHGDSGGPVFSMSGRLICTTSFGIHVEGDGFQVMGCYPPWFNKQDMAKIK